MKLIEIMGIAFGIGILLLIILLLHSQQVPLLNDVHNHADIKIVLNNEPYNLNQTKYMSPKNNAKSPFMHLHEDDGDILHQHISDGSLGLFFESISMNLSSECFILDNKTAYCNNEESQVRMYVNGRENKLFERYIFKDLDRILITFTKPDIASIQEQISKVTDKACIQSGKCPERGMPGNESGCTTEGGCDA